jgi:dTDP-glucose 4,6-dehydratase
MRFLVTGGAGFIGSNYVDFLLSSGEFDTTSVIVLDSLTYAGTMQNLSSAEKDSRFTFIEGDICDRDLVDKIYSKVDMVINFAAESHVDRSIESSYEFVKTNVEGTANLLQTLIKYPDLTYLHVSTDEVYGSISKGSWTETSPLLPNSPYAASKASSDLLALAFHKTYGLDIRISRCCNNYGPRQFPEKLIPLFVTNLIRKKKLPLYGDGLNSREWIHVEDHCRALELILKNGIPGEIYNIGTEAEFTNLELTNKVLDLFSQDGSQIQYVSDRLGHDLRYSLDSGKIRSQLGFYPKIDFLDGLLDTMNWYKQNEDWWQTKVKN